MQRIVIILSVLLAVAVATIAFLLGRITAPAPATANAPVAYEVPHEPPREVRGEQPSEAAREVVREPPAELSPPPREAIVPRQTVVPREEPRRPMQPSIASNTDRAALDTYLANIKSIEVAGGSDPNALAQEIMAGAAQGDTSGMDKLIASIDDAERRARALTPPPAAAEYHRMVLETMKDSSTVVREMKSALATGNLSALAGLASKAQTMQARAEQLEQLEKQLRGK